MGTGQRAKSFEKKLQKIKLREIKLAGHVALK
jgi:hypothetical protein